MEGEVMVSDYVKRLEGLYLFVIAVVAASTTLAAEPLRVLTPSGSTSNPAVLLVPGCSGFIARNGINHYEERAIELQAAGYFVVFVDYLSRRNLTDCAGGRNISQAEVAADILEAARWIKEQPRVATAMVFAIGWSYGGGGVLVALAAMPPVEPILAKAVAYYPDCRGTKPWSSTGVTTLMLLGAIDEVAIPALCDRVAKGVPSGSLRTIVYPSARHGFDMRNLPERTEFGRLGYNPEAAKASWTTVLEFLR
jgi:dienelactone hydrolase